MNTRAAQTLRTLPKEWVVGPILFVLRMVKKCDRRGVSKILEFLVT